MCRITHASRVVDRARQQLLEFILNLGLSVFFVNEES